MPAGAFEDYSIAPDGAAAGEQRRQLGVEDRCPMYRDDVRREERGPAATTGFGVSGVRVAAAPVVCSAVRC